MQNVPEHFSLLDLDSDLMRHVLAFVKDKISIRSVCKKMKVAVERNPGFHISLCAEGLLCATEDFFLRFNEPIVILKGRYSEDSQCLTRLCCAIQNGLIVQRIVLPIEDNTALKMALGLKQSLSGHHANVKSLEFGISQDLVSLDSVVESVRHLSEAYPLAIHATINCMGMAAHDPINEFRRGIGRLTEFAEVRSFRLW